MSRKKRSAYLFLLVFILLCLIPSVGMLIFGGSKGGANEILPPKPRLTEADGSFNCCYLPQLSDYLSSRLFLRQEAITVKNMLSAKLFATSPVEKVTLGRGNWLFYTETLNAEPLTEKELWCAGENLRLMQEYVESRGEKFLFVLCPNKAALCTEVLTNGKPLQDGQSFEKLLDELGVSHCSLYACLADWEKYFYHSDSHWNALGAAAAADTILASLGMKSEYVWGPFFLGAGHRGDLSEMLYPCRPTVENEYLYPFTFRYTSDYKSPSDMTINTASAGGSSLFCYRDSFGNDLHPFLAESFGKASFSRKAAYDLMEPKADTFLIELVERNIDYLYTYDHLYPAPKRELSLTAQDAEAVEVTVTETGGLKRISGSLSRFDMAPLYLLSGGRLYACAPKPAGFTLCLAEYDEEARLIYTLDGQLCSAPLITR